MDLLAFCKGCDWLCMHDAKDPDGTALILQGILMDLHAFCKGSLLMSFVACGTLFRCLRMILPAKWTSVSNLRSAGKPDNTSQERPTSAR